MQVVEEVLRLNEDPNVHGVFLCLPPSSLSRRVLDSIKPEKDVDGYFTTCVVLCVHIFSVSIFSAPPSVQMYDLWAVFIHGRINPCGNVFVVGPNGKCTKRSPVSSRACALVSANAGFVSKCSRGTADLHVATPTELHKRQSSQRTENNKATAKR